MSSVVVASLPVEGTFASGSGGGGARNPFANRRAGALYNSNKLTRGDRISLAQAQNRGESLTGWMKRRNIKK